MFDYLPDNNEIHKVSRDWICDIIASVLKNMFTDWLKKKIRERNAEQIEKKDLNIEMDPDVLAAFQESNSVSCKCSKFYFSFFNLLIILVSRGVGANLLKAGIKRRRTKAQIAEEEEAELRKQQETKTALEEAAVMRERLRIAEELAA